MEARNRASYEIEDRELVAEGADLRVQVLTLGAGQCVPWHHHSEITDHFVCLEGETVVETRDPDGVTTLSPGERYHVDPGQPHTVHGRDNGPCKFMIIQGVGTYDFVAES